MELRRSVELGIHQCRVSAVAFQIPAEFAGPIHQHLSLVLDDPKNGS